MCSGRGSTRLSFRTCGYHKPNPDRLACVDVVVADDSLWQERLFRPRGGTRNGGRQDEQGRTFVPLHCSTDGVGKAPVAHRRDKNAPTTEVSPLHFLVPPRVCCLWTRPIQSSVDRIVRGSLDISLRPLSVTRKLSIQVPPGQFSQTSNWSSKLKMTPGSTMRRVPVGPNTSLFQCSQWAPVQSGRTEMPKL